MHGEKFAALLELSSPVSRLTGAITLLTELKNRNVIGFSIFMTGSQRDSHPITLLTTKDTERVVRFPLLRSKLH